MGVIILSTSPFPITYSESDSEVIVKPDGSNRICIDYCKLKNKCVWSKNYDTADRLCQKLGWQEYLTKLCV